jgi:Transposase zinc-binding domain
VSRPPLEVADIVRCAGQAFLERSRKWIRWQHQKVLLAITRCRTAVLGGHRDQCSTCGHSAISYNSCRNRHCPKCQGNARVRWLEARQQELLPTRYVCSRSPAIPGILEPRSASSACSIPGISLLTDLMYRVGALPVTLLRCSVGAFPIPYLSCCSVSPLCSVLLFLQLYRPRPTPRAGECCPGTHIQTDLRIRSAKPWHQNHLCRPSRLNPVSGRGHRIAEVL